MTHTLNVAEPETTKDLSIACNLCGADDYEVLYEAGVAQANRIVRCRQCNLMYANPRANGADCESIVNWDPDWNLVDRNQQRFDKEQLQVKDYADTRAFLNKRYPNKGKIVEVGGGLGFLLSTFKNEGWDVLAVEPWLEACRYAEAEFGIEAIPSTLEDASLPNDSADAVIMLHVIEHVPDPVGTLSEIHRILKPGGHAIIETPRYDTVWFKLLGRRERSVSCDGHIYFFTSQSLQQTAEKAGLELVQRKYVGRHLTLDRLAWNLGVVSKSKIVQRSIASLSRKLRLQDRALHLNVGDMQRLYLRKPEQALPR